MSNEEQDAVVGRLVRENADLKRQAAIFEARREQYAKAAESLAGALRYNINPDHNGIVVRRVLEQGPWAADEFPGLLAFLDEYAEIRKACQRTDAQLRELGIR